MYCRWRSRCTSMMLASELRLSFAMHSQGKSVQVVRVQGSTCRQLNITVSRGKDRKLKEIDQKGILQRGIAVGNFGSPSPHNAAPASPRTENDHEVVFRRNMLLRRTGADQPYFLFCCPHIATVRSYYYQRHTRCSMVATAGSASVSFN